MPSDHNFPEMKESSGNTASDSGDDSCQVLVLDTSAFFLTTPFSGKLFTVPRVESELRDLRGKARFAVLVDEGMDVREPGRKFRQKTMEASGKSGDASVLSETDTDLLALACEVQGILVTDDFAIQNTAHALNIPVRSLIQRNAEPRIWKIRCTGCGKFFDSVPTRAGDCPVCGSPLKRKHK
jgi:UPF0271 protein